MTTEYVDREKDFLTTHLIVEDVGEEEDVTFLYNRTIVHNDSVD